MKQDNHQSSKELIPTHDKYPFLPIIPSGSLTPSPGTPAEQEVQSSFTQHWQQSVAEQCSPVWVLKSKLRPCHCRPESH